MYIACNLGEILIDTDNRDLHLIPPPSNFFIHGELEAIFRGQQEFGFWAFLLESLEIGPCGLVLLKMVDYIVVSQ